ncbi:probable carboxylesterase 12 [Aristolochia californica]|uniref:probable carboxylesterase 12 n=1 Tax=Aristolochia californica TaxID=171875 RepID=UPI0035D69651
MAGEEDTQIVFELPNAFRCYKSGRVERFIGTDLVHPGVDPNTGVSSKDVTLLPDVSARLFLPKIVYPAKKLPVFVHFHGGIFVLQTPFSATYRNYLTSLAADADALIISVHYRRAPEHPLPIAYEDSWAAFQWVISHAGGSGPEPWLTDHGDFSRIILGGDSAGANISHQVALRAGQEGILKPGSKLAGAVLVHPYFWGAHELAPKDANPQLFAFTERIWKFLCPGTSGSDDPLINPLVGWPVTMAKIGCGSVLVCVAEKDRLRPWGVAYYEGLKSSGWKGTVEIMESEGEDHVFHLIKPESEKCRDLHHRVVDFIKHVK